MLGFIIPVKSVHRATSWPALCRLFERCLRSVCRQTSSQFRVIVVCNEVPDINFNHSNVQFLKVDYPVPGSDYSAKVEDRAKRVVAGLLTLRDWQPSHVMSVDADDCISRRIAEHVDRNRSNNGWFIDSGYEYEDASDKVLRREKGFYKICGTCNIVNYQLFRLPKRTLPYDKLVGYDRFLGGHPLAKGDLAARGTPLEALPFPGAVFVRDLAGESVSMQESLLAKLRRNPREALRGVKKRLLARLYEEELAEEIREEFGLYPDVP